MTIDLKSEDGESEKGKRRSPLHMVECLIFDLEVPSVPLQSSKAPVLCAANKSDARVHAAGSLIKSTGQIR